MTSESDSGPAPGATQRYAPIQPQHAPQQHEMPLAMVLGQPMLQIPQDLYIPPDALEVILDAFEGPLDLLLYLIRRQNLDILDIPVAEITRQYVSYIQAMHEMRFELAADYLVMAAILAEIKSRMLLPRSSMAVDEEGDPRAELVRRLQEYERFKRAAMDIDELPRVERDVFQASAEMVERRVSKPLPAVTLQEMLVSLKDVLARAEMFAHHHIQRERPASVCTHPAPRLASWFCDEARYSDTRYGVTPGTTQGRRACAPFQPGRSSTVPNRVCLSATVDGRRPT